MADAPSLRVPDAHVDALRQFATLADDAYDRLVGVLDEDPPITRREELVGRIREQVPELTNSEGLVDALMSIDVLASTHDWTADQVGEGVSVADELELSEEIRERFAER